MNDQARQWHVYSHPVSLSPSFSDRADLKLPSNSDVSVVIWAEDTDDELSQDFGQVRASPFISALQNRCRAGGELLESADGLGGLGVDRVSGAS
jgi:hypothetical protein